MEKECIGIGFIIGVQVAAIILKLCKIIVWSWLCVLSPLFILTAISLLIVVVVTIRYL